MENKPLLYAIAGLLHDIGKFWQRADELWEDSRNLIASRGMSAQICPSRPDGKPGYQHVLWTYAFIDKYYQKFRKAGLADQDMGMEQLINLASYHHKPSTPEQGLITLADICSSGLDRSNEHVVSKNPEWGWDKYKSVPFASPFSVLNLKAGETSKDIVHPAVKLCIGEKIYPSSGAVTNNKELYPGLWKEFEADFSALPDANAGALLFSLYHLLKKYTSFIPASTQDYPESSLFEHLKTTGAFAHCFAAYKAEFPDAFGKENRISRIAEEHYPVKLLCGDISGIQSFIYNITNKAAAKSLKGRSFYVQMLAESIAREILEACGCSLVNQVYAAGGKFYVLLPNTSSTDKAINSYRDKLEQSLWDEFGGQLSVNIASVNFSFRLGGERPEILVEDEQEVVHVGLLWKMLADKTAAQKRRRFSKVFSDSFDNGLPLFEPFGTGGDIAVCDVSGIEIPKGKGRMLRTEDVEQGDSGDIQVADFVQRQIDLGRSLYAHRYLAELRDEANYGFATGVSSKWDILKAGQTANQQYIRNWIRTDHDDELLFNPAEFKPHEDNGLGWRLYGGTRLALNHSGSPATFEEIARLSPDDAVAKMGVLRMDVDNLGELFMRGFPENKRSFSALATLSSMLDLYFSGHLNYLRNKEKYRNRINIIYSGGDDLFAVGRWAELIEFAAEVREGFRKFTGRADITLSGGIAMTGPRFPIAKAAEMAGEAEEAAKHYQPRNTPHDEPNTEMKPVKNAITLFGIPLHWETDWPFAAQFKSDLVKWIQQEEIISKGLLMKLFDYYAQYARGEPDWQWRSAYTIARMKTKERSSKNEVLDKLTILLYTGNYNNQYYQVSFDAIIAAARWAEWEIKQSK